MPACSVLTDATISVPDLLRETLSRGGFWDCLEECCRTLGKEPSEVSVLIKPDVEAFTRESPTQVSAELIAVLVDILQQSGYKKIVIGVSLEFDLPWIENREALVLAEFAGHFNRQGDLLEDLSDNLVDAESLNETSVLAKVRQSRRWLDADIKVIVASNKTDQKNGYSLCLNSLLSAIPHREREKLRRQGITETLLCTELLAELGAHYAIIDGLRSAHGNAGSLSPKSLATNTIIAAENVILADYVGALKMNLSPNTSELFNTVSHLLPLDEVVIQGDLRPYSGWENVDSIVRKSVSETERFANSHPLMSSLFREVDTSLFPIVDPLQSIILSEFYKDGTRNYEDLIPLHLLWNAALSCSFYIDEALKILANKDNLSQKNVPMNVCTEDIRLDEFESMAKNLDIELQEVALLQADSDGFRAICSGALIKFEISHRFLVDYEHFCKSVQIAGSMQYLNDYIGGAIRPLKSDSWNRVTHQLERTVYLPQPNFVVTESLKYLDVTKIEYISFGSDEQSFYWKTIHSENDSAVRDDGIVRIKKSGNCTDISIASVQLLTLPAMWQCYYNNLPKDSQSAMTKENYKKFFLRTIANIEALVEGRSIRIGRETCPEFKGISACLEGHPAARLVEESRKVFRSHTELLKDSQKIEPTFVDECGFRHFKQRANSEVTARDRTSTNIEFLENVLRQLVEASRLDAIYGSRQQ